MNVSQLSKYMKSRMTPCIFCGKKITDNQEFQWCSTKAGRYVAYAFIHNDCIKDAQRYVERKSKLGSPYGSCVSNEDMEEVLK